MMNIRGLAVVFFSAPRVRENEDIDAYAGLAVRHPFIALTMSIFLPFPHRGPASGRVHGKFYIFSSAIKAHYYWLAIIAS